MKFLANISKKERDKVAKAFIKSANFIHQINDYVIVSMKYSYLTISKTSLVMNEHDTEEDALNSILDIYNGSYTGTQIELL